MFKQETALAMTEICQQLFSCCDTIKKLVVTPVAISVWRSGNLMEKISDRFMPESEAEQLLASTQ